MQPAFNPMPRVLTPGCVVQMKLQNRVLQQLRAHGCRLLSRASDGSGWRVASHPWLPATLGYNRQRVNGEWLFWGILDGIRVEWQDDPAQTLCCRICQRCWPHHATPQVRTHDHAEAFEPGCPYCGPGTLGAA